MGWGKGGFRQDRGGTDTHGPDQFVPEITAILGLHLIRAAPVEEDKGAQY